MMINKRGDEKEVTIEKPINSGLTLLKTFLSEPKKLWCSCFLDPMLLKNPFRTLNESYRK